jgi:hypothetical protein
MTTSLELLLQLAYQAPKELGEKLEKEALKGAGPTLNI